ncbi:LysR family transcriptional regulator [Pollutimonas harenae]|uniref:LysR family transcriptional regulator n=1 Tax=Pollutimonas harenae TaxID=657015 RepID=A0A853GWM9_9BURK|nr:LysR family transcriptional regulator [Pollutimonas harenae]NYT84542.1 LysR family transcriptional regulator [Pollutimonas harenae]
MKTAINNRISQMRIKHLTLLERLMEYRSLRKAAESLRISEPSASQLVRDIEAMFGMTLFDRGRRGMTPNLKAEALLKRARVILREAQGMENDLTSLSEGQASSFYLGALPRCMQGLVPNTLAHLYRNEFNIRVHILEGSSTVLLSALDRGELDLAITRLLDDHGNVLADTRFDTQVLYEEGMSIICGNDHELAKAKGVRLSELKGYSWVLPSSGSVTRKLIETEFLNAGLSPPKPLVECAISASQLNMVRTGHFIGICPSSIAAQWQQQKLIRVVQVALKVPLPPIVAAWHLTKSDDPLIATIKGALLYNADTIAPKRKHRSRSS